MNGGDLLMFPIPNADCPDSRGNPLCALLIESEVWTHHGHIARSMEGKAWRAWLGADVVRGLLRGSPDAIRQAGDQLGELIQECMERPLVVTYDKNRSRRFWSLVLRNGMRVVVNASEKTPKVLTMFFSTRATPRATSALLGTSFGDEFMFEDELFSTVLRYAKVAGSNRPITLPDRSLVKKIRDNRGYIVNRIRFVLPACWGFKSDQPSAEWSLPERSQHRSWSTGQTLRVVFVRSESDIDRIVSNLTNSVQS